MLYAAVCGDDGSSTMSARDALEYIDSIGGKSIFAEYVSF